MKNYNNFKFYFYVFFFFLVWCFYFSVDAKEVVLNVKSAEDLFDYENYYVSNFSKVQNGSVVDALPHLTRRTMNTGPFGSNNAVGTFPDIEGNNQLFPSNDLQGADNWRKNFLMPEAIPDFHPNTPMQSLIYFEFRIDSDYSNMKIDNEYQIGIKFRKDSNLTWGPPPVGDTLGLYLKYDDENDSVQDVPDSYINKTSRWLDTDDDNVRILVISFKLDSSQHVFPFEDFYFYKVEINYIGGIVDYTLNNDIPGFRVYAQDSQRYSFNNGIGFINNYHDVPYYFKITNFYFIEDGYISFDDVAYNYLGQQIDVTELEDYDSVEDSDLGIYESDEICGSTDVICHLRNIVKHIKNLFKKITSGFLDLSKKIASGFTSIIVKIGDTAYYIIDSIITGISNFFRSLFIPDDDYLNTFFSGNYNFLRSKLGILFYPFELIGNVLNRFLNIQTNNVISFSGFTLPIYNVVLIPAFTFNFIDYFNSHQALSTLYNYYMISVTAFLYIMFFLLCYKKFRNLIGSDKE